MDDGIALLQYKLEVGNGTLDKLFFQSKRESQSLALLSLLVAFPRGAVSLASVLLEQNT